MNKKQLPCPTEETIACYTDNLLSEKEKREVALHIVNCKRCSEIIEIHNKFINKPMDKEVPKKLKDWAKGLVRSRDKRITDVTGKTKKEGGYV